MFLALLCFTMLQSNLGFPDGSARSYGLESLARTFLADSLWRDLNANLNLYGFLRI